MKKLLLLMIAALCGTVLQAQLLTWSPPFPTEANDAQHLVITLDATKGNRGLFNYNADVYVHIGVITNKGSGWVHVPFDWGSTTAAAKATKAAVNTYTYTIDGSLRSFFGITDTAEHIQKIAILFRSASGDVKHANTDVSDMYIPVYPSGLAVRIDEPAKQPKLVPEPEVQNYAVGSSVTIAALASKASTLKIYYNGTLLQTAGNVQAITASATIAAAGTQQFVAEANDGSTAVYDTLSFFIAPSSSPVHALPAGVQDGINYEAGDTSLVLVLRAPGKTRATVIGDFNNWTQQMATLMNKTPDGKFFWLRLHPLTPGKEYGFQYVVDDTLKIADPYAEKILDPYNDPYIPAATYPNLKPYPAGQTGIVSVFQTGQAPYNWSVANFNRPDKRGLVIYELLVRDFVAAHNWKTVQDSLPYLKKLGINAIELMPFNEFEGNSSWGYNPDFYFAPDKYYGTKKALQEFIDACHQMGIAVIMDIVLNHSYGPSPLAQLYWDAAKNRPAANNPWYNPVQPHAFGFGDDFNHESADTKYFFNRVLQHWLTNYKIDGYRFDFSKGLTQKASTNDANFSAYDASRIAILKSYANTVTTTSANAYVILEHFADNTEEKELANSGMLLWSSVWTQYQEASMGWLPNSNFQNGIYTSKGWNVPNLVTYMESHDQERIVYKDVNFGNAAGSYNIKDTATALKRMELDAAFLFTIPGPKMIWQFGELGYPYSINTCEDGTVNENCRLAPKPIRWDYLQNPGRRAVYNTYSSLINLRFHPWYEKAFISGAIEQNLNGAVKWIKVTTDTSSLLVVGNFDVTPKTATVTFQTAGTWYGYLDSTMITTTGSEQNIALQPGEFHVYTNRNIHNLSATPVPNVPRPQSEMEVKAYPNPITAQSVLEITVPESGTVTAQLYNSLGQYITTLQHGFLLKGRHVLSLPLAHLNKGSYHVKISTKNGVATLSVSVQ